MNVLHVSGATSWGGNEQQLMYLIDELPKHGVDQKFFCYRDSPLHERLQDKPVELIVTDYMKPHSSAYRKFLDRVVKEHNIDIIHLHTSDAVTGYVLADIIYTLKTPTIYARKSIRRKDSFLSQLKYNYKNIHKITCLSEYVKYHFSKILSNKNKEKLVIVRNGVNLDENQVPAPYQLRHKLEIPDSNFLIGNIANHTKAKDLQTLVRAVHHLVNELKVTDFHLVQIGEFTKRTEIYKDLSRELGVESYITFLGFTEKASRFLPQFDVFVMSSEREGGPSSVIESFYYKTPVVSTKVGIVEEIIEDGKNGFSAEVGDYKKIAESLKNMKNDPGLREVFAEKSYQLFMKNFTAKRLGENTLAVYKSVLNQNK
ncbi:glycosyltransferase family 4 protein [Christiangramia sabulilitoris]|uniref:Glycosyltransferase family 4 protein n=1 Tax=Christiangramia sabulilitoris TaxID=2583991 RepID=A0A550I2W0_9FLAO|nr:glycosyltransferase family 4 protein [Christiangramia sabulilitoris]TRO65322.1 glycosyltransferase family 4 protein [Christiangramia sabulilitoris]